MRHRSHGCACSRRFADYRKRQETKQPGKTGCLCRSGVEQCHGCSARSGPAPDRPPRGPRESWATTRPHRYPTALGNRPGLSAHMVDHVDPFVLRSGRSRPARPQASDGPGDPRPLRRFSLARGKWHCCMERSAHPAAHFASNARRRSRSRVSSRLGGLSIEGASTSPRFADAVRLNSMQPCRLTLGRGNDQSPVGHVPRRRTRRGGPEEAAA
jgi:hypothetical protein